MGAVIKRELSGYFSSPIGYIVLAVFYIFSGYYFLVTLLSNISTLNYVFSSMFTIVLFLMPILTMRMWSEDKRQKTDQILFTAPVRLLPVTLGKYFAALIVYTLDLCINLVYAIVISFFAAPDWAVFVGNMIGLFLLGAALIAIGMFISSLTENQVVAAVGSFAVSLFILLTDTLASVVGVDFISAIIEGLSFNGHYTNFTSGILDAVDLIFFLSVSVVFIFLTVRVFEKKRWS